MLYNTTGVSKMQQWLKIGRHQVNEFLDGDPEYQELLSRQAETEQAYLRILKKLDAQDRQTVEQYISLCEELEYIAIPDSVTGIGDSAFSDCKSLTAITFAGTLEQWYAVALGEGWKNGASIKQIICKDGTANL